MKIVHINAFLGDGSTGTIVKDLHSLSLKNGIESYVVFSTSSMKADDMVNAYQMGSKVSKKLHALLSRINGRQGYFSSQSTKGLLKYLDNIKPDIVHLHNLHANYINLNMLLDYLAKKDISTVITLHDCWLYTGGCYHYTIQKCYKYQQECTSCPKKRTDLKSHLLDKAAANLKDRKEHYDKIKDLSVVGVSNWISSEAQKSILKNKKHVVIHNGIDTSLFLDTPSDMKKQLNIEGKFVITGLATKWLDKINKDAFDYVTSNLPSDCVFILFGCTKCQKESLQKNVIPLGYVNDKDELRKLYSISDVFINCSREDTLSLINIEPQSCGTPVIAYKNTGGKETVDNACSFLVEDGDYKSLFEKIIEVKQKTKNAFSENCRKFVTENFDKDKNYQKYLELYEKIYKEKNN